MIINLQLMFVIVLLMQAVLCFNYYLFGCSTLTALDPQAILLSKAFNKYNEFDTF